MIMQMTHKIRLTHRVESETRAAATDPVAVVIVSSPSYPSRTEDAPLFRAAMPRLFVVGLFCQLQNASSVWNCTSSKPTLETRKKVNLRIYFVVPCGNLGRRNPALRRNKRAYVFRGPAWLCGLTRRVRILHSRLRAARPRSRIRRHDPSPIFRKNGYVFSGRAPVRKHCIYAENIER